MLGLRVARVWGGGREPLLGVRGVSWRQSLRGGWRVARCGRALSREAPSSPAARCHPWPPQEPAAAGAPARAVRAGGAAAAPVCLARPRCGQLVCAPVRRGAVHLDLTLRHPRAAAPSTRHLPHPLPIRRSRWIASGRCRRPRAAGRSTGWTGGCAASHSTRRRGGAWVGGGSRGAGARRHAESVETQRQQRRWPLHKLTNAPPATK